MSQDEAICYIKKAYVQHWILKGLKMEFKVPKINKWDPHPINVSQSVVGFIGNNYFVLAESDRGPQIIQHKNMISTQFHIDPSYHESIIVLDNFIKAMI